MSKNLLFFFSSLLCHHKAARDLFIIKLNVVNEKNNNTHTHTHCVQWNWVKMLNRFIYSL